eukprot:TRINITY_DN3621_c0_g1_i2.p1 TRINITY_DN3621_c0_g1~~TRINITY_DN3621_c0_g1_i2.p1  ORF type:complete len:1898 (+),score=453.80 TRINITY_DN3621_c0_g1_i2:680-5695(+)
MMHHLWGDGVQLLVLPVDHQHNFFCIVENDAKDEGDSEKVQAGEHVAIYLDVSASMNHDEKGLYCAPNSEDHLASSIKKARNLLPPLVLAAIKRGTTVSLVPWNYKLHPAIDFTPAQFTDHETGELLDDETCLREVQRLTSDAVFRAKGGTNIEIALKDIAKQFEQLCTRVSAFVVWFITDGEETVYIKNTTTDEPDHIPTNPKDRLFKYFTEVESDGITQYQRAMVQRVHTCYLEAADHRCQLELHVCHLGEAHPAFLRALRDASDGHFHAVADVAALASEMRAAESGTNTVVTLMCGSLTHRAPAGVSDGAICARGVLPPQLADAAAAGRVAIRVPGATGERQLSNNSAEPLEAAVTAAVSAVLRMEQRLGGIMGELAGGARLTPAALTSKAEDLRRLRQAKVETIATLCRSVRAGTILQAYLEKVLESVEAQIDALTRLLEQYHVVEGAKYDSTTAQRNEFFKERDIQAIAAGLDSMRVRLGRGFVSQANLDRQVQRLVATHGPRARRMLNRVCLVAETECKIDGTSLLTLFIIEGDEHALARGALVKRLAKGNRLAEGLLEAKGTQVHTRSTVASQEVTRERVKLHVLFDEQLTHDADEHIRARVRVALSNVMMQNETLSSEMPFEELYPSGVVCRVHRKCRTDDLGDAQKRFIDLLSFSSFTDLIREHNTLPAALYTIGADQSVGLLFNAKELIYVVSGGAEETSFEYFRLFWRLAAKSDKERDPNGCVLVPGCFHKANFALPLAPEPLTCAVLTHLMPGLLSEFITGTPMAPLTATGNLYIGFLHAHMRTERITALDVQRIGELLATLTCWIRDPRTLPKPEEFYEMMHGLVTSQSISNADSPGKLRPEKALAYALADSVHPAAKKYSVLVAETLRRLSKLILVPSKLAATDRSRVSERLAQQQVLTRDYLRELVEKFTPPSDAAAGADPDIPVAALETAKQFAHLISHPEDSAAAVTFLRSHPHRARAACECLRDVVCTRVKAGLPAHAGWRAFQRHMFVWFAVATYPLEELLAHFASFRAPVAFEQHVANIVRLLEEEATQHFSNCITSWIEDGSEPVHAALCVDEKCESVKTRRCTASGKLASVIEEPLCGPVSECTALQLWRALSCVLGHWAWRGSASNCYGLHEVDWDVVRALKDPSLVDRGMLSQSQLAEFHAARDWRNAAYARWVTPKPEPVRLSDAHNFVAKCVPVALSGKPRLSVVFIGNVDAGKSTTLGHLVYKCGSVEKRVLDRYEADCIAVGKESHKYAWIMDRLRDERERGLTIMPSIWRVSAKNFQVDVIDCPGHRSFAKNMTVGVSMADVGCLVVSAAPNEFEAGIIRGGMTREEALVAYTQGVRQFIVLVNKMDTVKHDERRFHEISENVLGVLKQIGINTDYVPVVPISGWEGNGLTSAQVDMPWYHGFMRKVKSGGDPLGGFTLLDAFDACDVPARAVDFPLRIPVHRVFKIGGVGTVAVGRLACGRLAPGSKVVIMPQNLACSVGTIEVHHNNMTDVVAGDAVGINLKNIALRDLDRGAVICDAAQPLRPVVSFVAQLIIVAHPGTIRAGCCSYVFSHTTSFACRIVKLLQKLSRTGQVLEEHPASVRNGDCCLAELAPRSGQPVALCPYAECPPLGRLLLQDGHMTVAVGVVKAITTAAEAAATKAKAPPVSSAPSKHWGNKKHR